MKNKVFKITIILLLSVLCLNAQEEKKVHVKILKNIDGETIKIDTVFEGSEHEGIYFFSDEDLKEFKLDSILEKFDIKDMDGFKVLSFEDGEINTDSAKHIWVSVDSDVHVKDGKSGKHVIVKMSDGAKIIDCTDHFTLLGSDSVKIVKEYIVNSEGEDIYVTKKGDKKVIIKSLGKSDSYVWTTDSADHKVITITEDMKLEKGEEGTVNVFITKSDDEDITSTSEIILKKGDSNAKTIELYINEDGEDSEVKVIELEEKLGQIEGNVKITKYKTDDGKIVVKAVISDEECTKTDEEELEKLGLNDKVKLDVKKLEIKFNKSDGIFNIKFELEEKETTLIKVYNNIGEVVFSKKIKKFTGSYNGNIDFSKETEGKYYLKIIQGEKSFTHKILKK
ncbi:MAG: T9SS type A sorting domain-containing protein [Bacteroidales bacterium]|nr:T9SS type A sorting domain-containing protein [Bacteroidales bacterium]